MLGLGSNISKTGKLGVHDLGIVTSNLVLKHNYDLSSVQPLSSGAASFVRSNTDYIDCGDSSNFITGNNVTIATWIKVIGSDETYLIQNQKGFGSTNLSLIINKNSGGTAAGYVGAIVWGGSTHTYLEYDGNIDTSNKWHHLAVTTTSSEQKLYLDGVLVDTNAETFSNAASSYNMMLGSLNGTSSAFNGYMCNTGVWSAALSQAQVKSIMNKNYAGLSDSEKTDLVSWWNLDSVIPDTTTLVYDNHHGGEGEVLGGELLNCNSFNCADPAALWNEGSGWSFSGGKAIYDGTGGTSPLAQSDVIEVGKTYRVSIEVLSNEGTGPNTIFLGGTVLSAVNLSVGTHVFYGATNNTSVILTIYGRSGEVFEIGSVSVKEINGNTGKLS